MLLPTIISFSGLLLRCMTYPLLYHSIINNRIGWTTKIDILISIAELLVTALKDTKFI